jgi:hypothetical protein
MICRREFITLLGGAAAAWPLAARAQQTDERAAALLARILQLQANDIAAKIGQFIVEIVSQVGWTTQLPWSAGALEQRRFDALRLLRQVPAVTALALLDASGHEQLRVSRLATDVIGSNLDLSADPKFTEAVADKVYYGPVYLIQRPGPCEPDPSGVRNIDAIDGLGVYVTAANGQIKIVAPIENKPAAKAGIMAGDIIVALDGETVQGLTLGQVVEKMRGPVNTSVKLTIMRSGQDAPIELSVARDVIREGTRVNANRCLPVSQPASSGDPYMTLSLAGTLRESGVSVAEVNLKLVWDLIVQLQVGERGIAYLLDAQDRVIVHPGMLRPSFGTSVSSSDGDPTLFRRDLSGLAQVQAARAAGSQPTQPLVARDINGREVLSGFASVAGPGWHVFVELPLAEADTAVP